MMRTSVSLGYSSSFRALSSCLVLPLLSMCTFVCRVTTPPSLSYASVFRGNRFVYTSLPEQKGSVPHPFQSLAFALHPSPFMEITFGESRMPSLHQRWFGCGCCLTSGQIDVIRRPCFPHSMEEPPLFSAFMGRRDHLMILDPVSLFFFMTPPPSVISPFLSFSRLHMTRQSPYYCIHSF